MRMSHIYLQGKDVLRPSLWPQTLHVIMLAHMYQYCQGCRSAVAALKTAHPPHNAPQSEAWLQQQELNLSRVFCFLFRL